MKYRAKIDWWIGLSLIIAIVTPIAAGIAASSYWLFIAAAGAVSLILGCCWPQWYETGPDALIVRAGLITRRIPYSEINAVRPSSDSGSALALSLDRIQIEYAAGELLIAPLDRQAFLADVAARAPQLAKRGQALEIALV